MSEQTVEHAYDGRLLETKRSELLVGDAQVHCVSERSQTDKANLCLITSRPGKGDTTVIKEKIGGCHGLGERE